MRWVKKGMSEGPLMGWTGCFHRGYSLQGLTPPHREEHPMETTTKTSPLASIGIDIGKKSSTSSASALKVE
jgi:hypothetical protein